jgi:hypothetical protein
MFAREILSSNNIYPYNNLAPKSLIYVLRDSSKHDHWSEFFGLGNLV